MAETITGSLDVEAEYFLTPAEWAEARKKYYRTDARAWNGIGGTPARDDARAPLVVPAGTVWLRKVTAVQALDAAVVGTKTIRYRLVYGDPASDIALPAAYHAAGIPDIQALLDVGANVSGQVAWGRPASDIVAFNVTTAPNLSVTYTPNAMPLGEGSYQTASPQQWIGRWVGDGLPALAVAPPPPASDWWYALPWAQQVSLAFVPPTIVSGPVSLQAATVVPFPAGKFDAVLVRRDHPYLPAEVLERQRVPGAADVVVGYHVRVPVRSRAIAYIGAGSENYPVRRAEGWTAILSHERSENLFQAAAGFVTNLASEIGNTVERAGRAIAKGDVEAIGVAALATAVTGPAGLALLGSKNPIRDASRLGAIYYAFNLSPLTALAKHYGATGNVNVDISQSANVSASVDASPVSVGVTEMQVPRYGVGTVSATPDDLAAAEVWSYRLTAAAPDEAQRILVELARQGGFVDLILARLTIEAEADAKKREALKAELVTKQARFWDDYGQYIAKALAQVLSLFGSPLAGELAFALVKLLYEGAIRVQQAEVALRAQRVAEREAQEEMARLEAQLAALDAELAAADASAPVPAQAPAPTSQAPTPTAKKSGWEWIAWLVRRWTK